MANALYRQVAPDTWINQGLGGAPAIFVLRGDPQNPGQYLAFVSWDGATLIQTASGLASLATAQESVAAYIAELEAGTA